MCTRLIHNLGNLLGIRLLMLRPLKQIHIASGKIIMLGCDPISLYMNLIYVVAIIQSIILAREYNHIQPQSKHYDYNHHVFSPS